MEKCGWNFGVVLWLEADECLKIWRTFRFGIKSLVFANMPWEGYNFEDVALIRKCLVRKIFLGRYSFHLIILNLF